MLHKPDLSVSLGQATSAGPKPCNDDFHGALLPEGEVRVLKGLVFALADGISTSELSAQAAQTAVKSLLSDYITTPESWTVKTAASRVIAAANSWLHAQTSFAGIRDRDRGHVCTLSALILKGRQAHLFHVGDSRIWRLAGSRLEPLTTDHRVRLEGAHEVLSRAIGAEPRVEIDYACESVRQGDVFLLTSDGLHEHWDMARVVEGLTSGEALDALAERIVAETAPISDDNLTLQIVRVESLPLEAAEEVGAELAGLPWPRDLAPGRAIDGYTLLREIHANHRSQIFLAEAPDGTQVALKVPASALRDDRAALRRFMCEEWVARRLSHPNVLSAPPAATARTALYSVTDYVEGQTLRQWMHDTPEQTLDDVRSVIGQTIKALRAFHRREMLHQDLRPENIMLGAGGRLTLIDFGSAYVAGVQELGPQDGAPDILGTFQYTAPEYFTGEAVSWRSDMFSLGVIAYEMLTGRLPYGAEVAKIRTPRERRALRYTPAGPTVPPWFDEALRRAVHPDPAKRYDTLSEFEVDLSRPSLRYLKKHQRPLMERHPVRFWQTVSALLGALCLGLAFTLATQGS